jgi:HAD superfamily hydrolase (TIGR01509 family)
MIKAILFDVDDTLLDWSGFGGDWFDIEKPHLLRVYEYIHRDLHPLECSEERFIDEYFRRVQNAWASARNTLVAPHLGRILVDTAVALGTPNDLVEMEQCLIRYAWEGARGVTVFPDVPEVMPLLKERGLRFGLVTNAFHPMILRDQELQIFGLMDFFPECRISAADAGYLKPHHSIFAEALRRLNLTPDEVIFVGDNVVADIAGAQGAGMRAVLRIKKPAQGMISGLIVPDAAINTLHELPTIIDEWDEEDRLNGA